jgi:hypothetical protein
MVKLTVLPRRATWMTLGYATGCSGGQSATVRMAVR